MGSEKLTEAVAVRTERFAECGPGDWWFIHHPDGFLIECGSSQTQAERLAREINAGRSVLAPEIKEANRGEG